MNNKLLILLFISTFVLNNTNLSSVIIFGLLILMFLNNLKNIKYMIEYKLFFILFTFISFLIGVFNGIPSNQLIRYFTIIILIYTYPLNISLTKNYYKVFFVIGIYLVAIQILRIFNINFIDNFIDKFYPIEENVWGNFLVSENNNITTVFENRLSGIYYNPNIMGQSILILYILLSLNIKKYFNNNYILLTTLVCFLSILLTGSRTSMFTFILIFISNLYFNSSKKNLLIIFIPIFILFTILVYNFELRVFSNMLHLFSDKEDSGSAKLVMFINYLKFDAFSSLNNILTFIFGKLNWDTQFDADPGYIINFFGIIGLINIALFFIKIYSTLINKHKYVYYLFLTCIGATIIMNYRFSILTFLILSLSNKKNISIE